MNKYEFTEKEPILESYALNQTILDKYKNETLDFEFQMNKYLQGILVVFILIYLLDKNAIEFIKSQFLVSLFIGPVLIFICWMIVNIGLLIFIGIVSSIIKTFHPYTKAINNYKNDVKIYNDKFEEFTLNQLKLKKEFWYSLSGHEFEYEVAKLFEKIGFKTEVTKGSDDKGVDINLWSGKKYIVVQCKAHKKRLSPAISRELYGTMKAHNAHEAFLVTLEGVSVKSLEFLENKPIKVFDLASLISMQNQFIDQPIVEK